MDFASHDNNFNLATISRSISYNRPLIHRFLPDYGVATTHILEFRHGSGPLHISVEITKYSLMGIAQTVKKAFF